MLFLSVLCFQATFIMILVTVVDLQVTKLISIVLWISIFILSVVWTLFLSKWGNWL